MKQNRLCYYGDLLYKNTEIFVFYQKTHVYIFVF